MSRVAEARVLEHLEAEHPVVLADEQVAHLAVALDREGDLLPHRHLLEQRVDRELLGAERAVGLHRDGGAPAPPPLPRPPRRGSARTLPAVLVGLLRAPPPARRPAAARAPRAPARAARPPPGSPRWRAGPRRSPASARAAPGCGRSPRAPRETAAPRGRPRWRRRRRCCARCRGRTSSSRGSAGRAGRAAPAQRRVETTPRTTVAGSRSSWRSASAWIAASGSSARMSSDSSSVAGGSGSVPRAIAARTLSGAVPSRRSAISCVGVTSIARSVYHRGRRRRPPGRAASRAHNRHGAPGGVTARSRTAAGPAEVEGRRALRRVAEAADPVDLARRARAAGARRDEGGVGAARVLGARAVAGLAADARQVRGRPGRGSRAGRRNP